MYRDESTLEICRLTTLETRAQRADLLEVYKIMNIMDYGCKSTGQNSILGPI